MENGVFRWNVKVKSDAAPVVDGTARLSSRRGIKAKVLAAAPK
jgi:hypothetical protein